MKRILGYFLIGYLFVLLQSALWPALLPISVKPDLLLMHWVTATAGWRPGSALQPAGNVRAASGAALFGSLGACLDAMAGSHPGLHGVTLLIVFFTIRFSADHLNTESSLLLLFMVGVGTLLHAGLQALFSSFADAGMVWWQILRSLITQLLLNLLTALAILLGFPKLSPRVVRRSDLPAAGRLDRRYGS